MISRDDLITALLWMIADEQHPPEVFFGELLSANDPSLTTARAALDSYATDLLIDLHMSAKLSIDDAEHNSHFLFASEGRSGEWIRTYQALLDDPEEIFRIERYYVTCTVDAATSSLSLYPELAYENTDSYYRKATALSGVVTTIQYEMQTTEGYYDHEEARLLRYVPDPNGESGVSQLVRIASSDLTKLILNHPRDWERIAQIVIERQSDDVELITAILDAGSISQIANGIL